MNTERPSPGWRQLSLVPQAWRNSTQPDISFSIPPHFFGNESPRRKDHVVPTNSAVVGLVATIIPTPLIIKPPDELQ
jgi:hypothetical protein